MTARPYAALRLLVILCLSLGACTAGRGWAANEPNTLATLHWRQLLEVAAVLAQHGEVVRAQQYLQEALRQGAPAELVVPRLLQLYVSDGQYRLATEQAEHYLRARPRDHDVRVFLAALYGALSLPTLAVAEYARALKDRPADAQAHFALASTLHDGGLEPLRADQHFRAYLALEPQGVHAEEARSCLLTELP